MRQPQNMQIPLNLNDFCQAFPNEMPNSERPQCASPAPCAEVLREFGAQDTEPLPFESLLTRQEVSDCILVTKCEDSFLVPEDRAVKHSILEGPQKSPVDIQVPARNNSGLYTCSPAVASTPTPVAQKHQKVYWADLSDDEESSPWMTAAIVPSEERYD
eukprot:gnl/MRDRNA2_/MRDRNA2_25375_c0_seq2.p1 gnl/MRDRNA2_/MRDRNA2_25375_c0~~gnl/MRDRNA2_/MRDRNA2_25375_c0_seq2.p1  ORF type:complete len:159 (+),score=17.89 gnl/MRDRNA2_/MRDRNA2_25375_c0_seq2:414-890(+)